MDILHHVQVVKSEKVKRSIVSGIKFNIAIVNIVPDEFVVIFKGDVFINWDGIIGKQLTSTVVGLSGSAGALSALVLNPFIGYVVMKYSYSPLWWYAGLMYPATFVFFLLVLPKIENKRVYLSISQRYFFVF
jgi:hypothetical protein